jgi:hypothetical protein
MTGVQESEVGAGVGVAGGPPSWRPREVHDAPPIDLVAAEEAAAALLVALGQPLARSGMVETPLLGAYRDDPSSRAEFLSLTREEAGR